MNKKTRDILSAVLVLGAITSLLFGISLMRHEGSGDHPDCFAAILNSGKCDSATAFQAFVLCSDAFLKILAAAPANTGLALLVLFGSILFAAVFFAAPDTQRFPERSRTEGPYPGASLARILHWISIHEKRDPLFVL